jgi:prepilin-type N-terminal cleavage/methylation domain-containing protein
MSQQPRGFTLIELLVVISIIALLISILLPALAGARSASDVAQSLSNSRQVTISLFSYTNDWKQYTPYVKINNRQWAWILFSKGYAPDVRAFWGRSRDISALDLVNMKTNASNNGWNLVGYGVTATNGINGTRMALPRMDVQEPMPSRMIALSEGFNRQFPSVAGVFPGCYFTEPRDATDSPVSTDRMGLFNTRGVTVASFFDGHAKASSGSDFHWNPSATNGAYVGGPYGGWWTGPNNTYRFNRAPWYLNWSVAPGVID